MCNNVEVSSQTVGLGRLRGERDIRGQALAAVRGLLPPGWKVEPAISPANGAEVGLDADTAVWVEDPQGASARVIVEARDAFAPRDVDTILGGRLALARHMDPTAAVLVFAPWLSPRSRAALTGKGIGYVDLTGNASLVLERPAVVIRTDGAGRDPAPPPRRSGVTLRGTVAGRVVRLLADVAPPYTPSEVAAAAGVSVAYVSRVLATLDREALVERGRRGVVVDVDWAGVLRRRAETYGLFATNEATGYLSGMGAAVTLGRLRDGAVAYWAVTGSFAAVQQAPVAAPAQLVVYVDDAETTAAILNLLPADVGADVVLLRPYDVVVADRSELVDGFRVVAPSQLALDCLAGNGRMPAEGEALLEWMAADVERWRRRSIKGLSSRAPVVP